MGKPVEAGSDTWMVTNNGHWEGDTLMIDVTGLNGLAWFDRAGNYASDNLHVVERFTRVDASHLNYEATIEDPKTFTRPWKISMPLYRRVEKAHRSWNSSASNSPKNCSTATIESSRVSRLRSEGFALQIPAGNGSQESRCPTSTGLIGD
jgi:hypothetical protein